MVLAHWVTSVSAGELDFRITDPIGNWQLPHYSTVNSFKFCSKPVKSEDTCRNELIGQAFVAFKLHSV